MVRNSFVAAVSLDQQLSFGKHIDYKSFTLFIDWKDSFQ